MEGVSLPSQHNRHHVTALWVVAGAAVVVGHLMHVRSELGRTPLLSANDRSRWATVRSLVEHGTYALDPVMFTADGKQDREWYSIDIVRHVGQDGREHFYSSKPPLFPTLVAGLYWGLRAITGASLANDPFYVVRSLLLLVNVLPLIVYWCLIAHLAGRWCTDTWQLAYIMAAAVLGTLLTPFAVTLNNHLPAAVGAALSGWLVLRIITNHKSRWYDFAGAGFFAGWTVVNELPAVTWLVATGWGCASRSVRMTFLAFLPSVLLWCGAFEICNYVAHQSWLPPYMHRSDGPVLGTWQMEPPEKLQAHTLSLGQRQLIQSHLGLVLSEQARLIPRHLPSAWILLDESQALRLALAWEGNRVTARQWDNWYEFEGTYWTEERKRGVDRGEPNAWIYLFHVLIGHHGLLSLTPIWWLIPIGIYRWWHHPQRAFRWVALGILIVSVVVLTFYVTRPVEDRNYGGVSCGMRWLLWLTPVWMFCLIGAMPIVSQYRWSRGVAVLLLAASIFSVAYSLSNPWRHPWIFDYWSSLGWIRY